MPLAPSRAALLQRGRSRALDVAATAKDPEGQEHDDRRHGERNAWTEPAKARWDITEQQGCAHGEQRVGQLGADMLVERAVGGDR